MNPVKGHGRARSTLTRLSKPRRICYERIGVDTVAHEPAVNPSGDPVTGLSAPPRTDAAIIVHGELLQIETRSYHFRKEKLRTLPVDGSHHAASRRVDAESPSNGIRPVERGHPDLAMTLVAGYDAWASDYDADMARYGYQLPERMADAARHHIEDRRALVLDAGAGSGLLGKALKAVGYDNLVALDPSPGMLRQAYTKGLYKRQLPMALGSAAMRTEVRFDAALAAGVFKAGHAPPEAFADLVQLVRPGGIVIFNLGAGADAVVYDRLARRLAADRKWRLLSSTAPFPFLATRTLDSMTLIHVFQTISTR